MPFVRRTRAILRIAEFGFFGVIVVTFKHTPRLYGLSVLVMRFFTVLMTKVIAGDLDFFRATLRGCLMSWLIVDTVRFVMETNPVREKRARGMNIG